MKQQSFGKTFGLAFVFVFFCSILIATNFAGCYPENQNTGSSGCGTQMGCCPATGCGNKWHGNVTNLCYATANACSQAGNNRCRQCY